MEEQLSKQNVKVKEVLVSLEQLELVYKGAAQKARAVARGKGFGFGDSFWAVYDHVVYSYQELLQQKTTLIIRIDNERTMQ